MTKNKKNVSFHSLFWIVYMFALLGSFEQAYQNGQPIWSGLIGFPFLHHYLMGFIGIAILWVWAFKEEYLSLGVYLKKKFTPYVKKVFPE